MRVDGLTPSQVRPNKYIRVELKYGESDPRHTFKSRTVSDQLGLEYNPAEPT